ncbi:MAG: IS66 family insertion sequence element accessory protein TnpB [Candidatus Babeliales bacterium]|nr:IS66 family insertion sequence element accessory protein TnpB [Candidatus Babeliales bacterium]
MLKINSEVKIYVSINPIDARKSIDGLMSLVHENNFSPQSGNLFLFFNKARDKVKCIYWDRNGYVLHYKRLEKHKFIIPKLHSSTHLEITETQLQGLLAGLDFMLMAKFSEINYSQFA